MEKLEHVTRYRPNVAMIILNEQGRVFVGERVDSPGSWQIPQGGIRSGQNELPEQAMWRELAEELGVIDIRQHCSILAEHPDWLSYDFPDWVQKKGGRFSKYQGQVQKYYLLRFHGNESLITLTYSNEREFLSFRWIKISEVIECVAPFKRGVLQTALSFFIHKCQDCFIDYHPLPS